ncbi:tRNA pseudouridine(55) synthase TruB [Rarobacter incanus]|uniref:tRNA pseudouridine(55) synthase TruB n=1 Tax=Rarobacter incanus TaxID=153494 RepID=UPI00147771F9|nr:tRNA pseudouridine(55) synthase TruB [Rarobacter incanus]
MNTKRIDTRPWAKTDNGVIVVDKPQGWTSHDVVGKIRSLAKNRRVGHAGTLDPMATGVLVVGIGRGTKLLQYIVDAPKEYVATVRLGVATSTEDAEGEVTLAPGCGGVDADHLARVVERFVGDIQQVPSAVSAIKVDGKRAYARVRAGETVELAARPITIHSIFVLGYEPQFHRDSERPNEAPVPVMDVTIAVRCGAGTYIRALGRDIAHALGTVGHLTALRRTSVGGFSSAQARTPTQLEGETISAGALAVTTLADAAAKVLPVRLIDENESAELGYGRSIDPSDTPGVVAAIGGDGELVALVNNQSERAQVRARPVLVVMPR